MKIILMLSIILGGNFAFANCSEILYGDSEWSFEHTVLGNVDRINKDNNAACDFNMKAKCLYYKAKVSAVSCAVLSNKEEAVQKLIELRVDLNSKDADGKTPLAYAVSTQNVSILAMLVKAGATDEKLMQLAKTSKDKDLLALKILLLKEDQNFKVCDIEDYGLASAMFFLSKNLSSKNRRDQKLVDFTEKVLYPLSKEDNFNKVKQECMLAKKNAKPAAASAGAP